MPKVSICIPTYKQVDYLRKTLNSVLAQDFHDYELIITDDSSDDSVENLLKEFDFKGKLKYYRNTVSLGSPANWNYSLKQASGDYLKILHHDDFFTSENSLSKFVKFLDNNPSASFAFSGTVIDLILLKTKKIHSCSNKQFSKMLKQPDRLFFSNYIGAPSATIIRKDSLLMFDESMKWLVDVDWYMQLIFQNPNVIFSKEPLICTVHGGEGQVTQAVYTDKEVQVKEHVYLFEKLADKKGNLKKYSLLFQLLFHKYGVRDLTQLKSICSVPAKSEIFYLEVLNSMKSTIFLKKIVFWLKKKSFNDHIFTLKTYFK